MARPNKFTVEYFSHDVEQKTTLFILQKKFKNDGYAVWYKTLELIGKTPGHYYDCTLPVRWQFYLAYIDVPEALANEIIETLVQLDALDRNLWEENKILWSQNFIDRLSDVYHRREMGLPPKPNGHFSVNDNINLLNDSINTNEPSNMSTKTGLITVTMHKVTKGTKGTIYIEVFNLWNDQGIIVHKKLTELMKFSIEKTLKEYTLDEISDAIKTYAEIVNSDHYYFNFKWTLTEFLTRKNALPNFIETKSALERYLNKTENKKQTEKPSQTARGEISAKDYLEQDK